MQQSIGSQRVGHDLVTEQQVLHCLKVPHLLIRSTVDRQVVYSLVSYVSCLVVSDSLGPYGL